MGEPHIAVTHVPVTGFLHGGLEGGRRGQPELAFGLRIFHETPVADHVHQLARHRGAPAVLGGARALFAQGRQPTGQVRRHGAPAERHSQGAGKALQERGHSQVVAADDVALTGLAALGSHEMGSRESSASTTLASPST